MENVFLNRFSSLVSQLTPFPAASPVGGSQLQAVEARYTRKDFLAVWEQLRGHLVGELPALYEMPPYVLEWVGKMLDNNVPGGKLNRGLTVVHTALLLNPRAPEPLLLQAAVLGWCVEILQAFFLVADDVMDSSVSRRGKPCWYLSDAPVQLAKNKKNKNCPSSSSSSSSSCPSSSSTSSSSTSSSGACCPPTEKVGLIAINDAFILEAAIYRLLKHHFGASPLYVPLIDLFTETTYQTELGQLLDLTSQPQGEGNVDVDTLTLAAYSKIVIYKTAFYSFYMPVALGMLLCGYDAQRDRAAFQEALGILLPMGEFFQIQDDYLDCYGEPHVIGKVGRDIEEKKCGWMAVQALVRATPADRALFEECYGRNDPACVAKIKQLYKRMDLEKVYHDYEELSYQHLTAQIAKSTLVSKHVYQALLEKIYKRSV